MNPDQVPDYPLLPRPTGIGPALFAVLLLLVPAAHTASAQAAPANPMPEFQLEDVNPNSPRFNAIVSPRDYRLQISAYYFGDAG